MKNKLTSLLTAMCMLMTLLPQIVLPQTAFAAMGGAGTVSDPYQISTAAELFEFAQKVNGGEKTACAKLTANIDMTGQAAWTTICETGLYWNGYPTDGTMDDGYSGVFDGQGHTISNLALASSTTRDASCGLFGTVSGTIKNLKMTNTTFTYGGKDIRVGSIVGQLIRPTGLISDCCVTDATIKPGKHVVGGLAGCAYEARIENCMVLNSSCSGSRVGAIVADTRADNGADDMKATVINCYSNNSPIIGTQSGTIIDCETVPWSMVTSGELAYLLQNGNSKSIWGQNIGKNDIPIFNDPKVYQNTCADVTFYSNTNQSYDAHSYSGGKCSHCGAAQSPSQSGGVYQIGSADQLFAFATIANSNKTASAVLTADIDLQNKTWTTICPTGLYYSSYDTDLGYAGTFDGQGHVIKNLALASSSTAVATCGLFGTVSGTVKNLGIEGVSFTNNGYDFRVGAVVGQLIKSTGHVTNCYVANMTVPANNRVAGGIAGCVYEGTIDNCMVYGSDIHGLVSTSDYRYGHIVGDTRADNSTTDRVGIVTNCYTDGDRACGSHTGTITTCEANVTAERIASGEIAFLLQGSQTEQIWGQTVGTDSYPRLKGATVYKTTCVDKACYANRSAAYTYHSYVNGKCIRCGDAPLAGQSGTYKIATADQMCAFSSIVNGGNTTANAELTADITVSTDTGYVPIGTGDNMYGGTFDGKNHTLTVNLSGGENISPFAWVSGATVKNLTVDGTITVTNKYAAGIASEVRDGFTLTNCISKVAITSSVGGDGTHGGLLGNNAGKTTITNCAFLGSINGSNTYACGGLIGWSNQSTTIKNSYVAASFDVNTQDSYTFSRKPANVTLTNCYYLTALGTGNTGAAQLTADQFASGEAAFKLNESKSNGTWKQTLKADEYPNFTGSAVYQNTCVDVKYYSNTQGSYAEHEYDENDTCIHCGTVDTFQPVDGVYQIRTAQQLKKFAEMVNNGQVSINGKLMNNIDLSEICGENVNGEAINWTPIGSMSNIYKGTFDGQGYTVSGLYINDTSSDRQGLFGLADLTAEIKNLHVSGSVSGAYYVGGVVGYSYGKVTGCSFSGSVSGSNYVGGVLGCNDSGTVTDCCNTGTVSGSSIVGGVAGSNNIDCTVSNCYNTGAVSGTSYVGGVAGSNNTNCTVSNCYNTGAVSGTSTVGSVVGYNSATITNNYYLTGTASGGIGGADAEGKAEAKTEVQFASGEVAYLLNGSKTDGAWGQTLTGDTIDKYPVLGGAKVYPSYNKCLFTGYTNDANATVTPTDHTYVDGVCSVCGAVDIPTVDGVYQIGTAQQLKAFAQLVNNGNKDANAVLTADIDLNNEAWTTICETGLYHLGYGEDLGYAGTFDGQGHTISNLALVSSSEMDSSCGLFGTVSGTIKNLSIDVATFKDGGKDMRTGTIVGQLITENGLVTDCMVTKAAITPGAHVTGGIAGCVYEGRVENCLVLLTAVTGTNHRYGLIVGDTRGDIKVDSGKDRPGTVTNCYTDGTNGTPIASGQMGTITDRNGSVSTGQLASGEIAMLLQNGRETTAWGQVLKTESYPKPGSANRVYLNYTDCIHKEYSNDASGSQTPIAHNIGEDGLCTVCGLDREGRFVISSFDKLKEFATRVNNGETALNAIMTADITAATADGFVPIGTDAHRYGGTFDGQGHTLTLDISGGESMGAPFAYATGATIKNLTTAGTISASGKYAAGFVSRSNNVTLENCLSKVTIDSTVDGDGTHGGLIGTVNGTSDKPVTITNCGFAGAITGSLTSNCGGLIGWTDKATMSNITNSYVAATFGVKADGSDTFSRNPDYAALTNCYYLTALGAAHGPQLTKEQFASGEAAWRMNNADSGVWKQTIGEDAYPSFAGAAVYQNLCASVPFYGNTDEDYSEHVFDGDYCTRCGALNSLDIDEDGTYHIKTPMELAKFAYMVNNGKTDISGKLMNNIDLSEICGEGKGNWTPIGTFDNKYTGTFDGQGYTVSGLYINTNAEHQGLFGYAGEGAVIKSLTVGGSVSIDSYGYVGGVVGYNKGTVENCCNTATISGGFVVGGVVGQNIGTVTTCRNTGSVSIDKYYKVGGVVGQNESGTVTNCCNTGSVSGPDRVGGVVGELHKGTVENCYNTGTVSGSSYFGSVVGFNGTGTVTNCCYLTVGAGGAGTAKTAAQFASGEVAYLLNGSKADGVWKQTIGTDDYPSFTGGAVYKNTCVGNTFYSNTDGDYETHDFDANGICTRCGTADAPTLNNGVYEITNAGQLKTFADMVNGGQVDINGKLMNDIDLSAVCGEGKDHWTPIGNTDDNKFNGAFDGQGYTVSGLYINNTDADGQGLFGRTYLKAEIKNLHVDGNVKGSKYTGGVVGTGFEIKLINCSFSGTVAGGQYVGGVIGNNINGTVTNCYNTGSVSGTSEYVGGVIGYNWGSVSNCYNTGTVSGTWSGSIVGYNNSGTVTNCYYLTGTAKGGIQGNDAEGQAEVKTEVQFASGEVAWLLNGSTADGVWKQTLTGDTPDAYPNFTGSAVYQNNCGSYVFYDNTGGKHYDAHTFVDGVCTQCGTHDTPTLVDGVYEISTAHQLKAFAGMVNGGQIGINGKLMNNIDLSSVCGAGLGDWTPIGSESIAYKGTFDGQGHTVSGLYINNTNADCQGLFGYASNGSEIKNLNVSGSVSGKENVGGVIGENYGTITNCSFSGTVSSSDNNIGGVIGKNYSTVVTNCYNAGSVSGDDHVGGVVGENLGTVSDCYNTGTISCSYDVGGIVGWNCNGTVTNCYNTGKVSSGYPIITGGVVGRNSSGTVTNCYYMTGTAEGGINGTDTEGSAEPKTEAQFKSGKVAWLLNGSVDTGVWKQTIGTDDYPNFTGLDVYYNADTEKYYNITGDVEYTNKVLKKIPASETKDNSEATAVLSQIDLNGNAVNSITWKYGEYNAQYQSGNGKPELSGESTVYFGIVVPALLEAQENQTTDEIAVNID